MVDKLNIVRCIKVLVARWVIRHLLLLWLLRGLIPGIGNLVTATSGGTTALLSLVCGLFQFSLKFVK